MTNCVRESSARPELLVALDEHGPVWRDGLCDIGDHAYTVRRIRHPELRGGIRAREELRAEWVRSDADPARLVVALEIDVLIAVDAGTARSELRRLGETPFGDTVRYVGTAHGLSTLILDVYAAGVADAVILRPLDRSDASGTSTSALIADQVLPVLKQRSPAA